MTTTKTRLEELVEILADPKTSVKVFEAALVEWREINGELKGV